MFVDTAMLHSGASASHQAGRHAQAGADHLAEGPLAAGMFGDFAAADVFHEKVTAAHAHHVQTLRNQREILGSVGRKATHAAVAFTAMEHRNEEVLRDVRCT